MSPRARPGAGFVLLVTVTLGALAFFVWGARTPALDEVWELLVRLEVGENLDLSRRERALLQDSLARYPSLAESILDGAPSGLISANDEGLVQSRHAYAVRREAKPGTILVVEPPRAGDAGLVVKVRAGLTEYQAAATREAALRWELPSDGPFPQLIEVTLDHGDRNRVRQAALVRLEARP